MLAGTKAWVTQLCPRKEDFLLPGGSGRKSMLILLKARGDQSSKKEKLFFEITDLKLKLERVVTKLRRWSFPCGQLGRPSLGLSPDG